MMIGIGTLMQACGVATIFIGASGTLSKMFVVIKEGGIETQGTMPLIFSLVLGAALGEWINIEQKMDILEEKIKKAVIFPCWRLSQCWTSLS